MPHTTIDAPPNQAAEHASPVTEEVRSLAGALDAFDKFSQPGQTVGPVDRLLAIRDIRDAIKDLDKAVGALLNEEQQTVLEWMAENAVDSVRQEGTGRGVHVRHVLRASIPAAALEHALPVLDELGLTVLAKKTVNAQTFTSWVREQVAEARDDGRLGDGDPILNAIDERLRPYVNAASLTELGTSRPRS